MQSAFRRGGYLRVSRVSILSLKLHKVISKDENASRKSKDEKISIVVHSFCFELNLLMLNRSCSSNIQLSSSINSSRSVYYSLGDSAEESLVQNSTDTRRRVC